MSVTLKIPEHKFKLKSPEFQKNDEEFFIWFLEGVLENYPSYVECLMYLGNLYTTVGMCDKGLKIDLRLAELKPYDPLVHYNLACSYSLLGKVSRSLIALSKAIELGYDDIKHMEEDSDLDSLRNEEGYKALINKLKEAEKGSS
ncbi:MAG: tetratricopeptide repeat protein [Candidatus Scalinduaceae bacterium]